MGECLIFRVWGNTGQVVRRINQEGCKAISTNRGEQQGAIRGGIVIGG